MSTQVAGCCFCETVAIGSSRGPWDTIVAETRTFVVTPTKGTLIPGWLLVIGKRHALCSGALSENELPALERAIQIAKDLVVTHFGKATIFEHGPSRTGTATGCGVDHIHIHVAPLQFSLTEAVSAIVPVVRWRSISDISETKTLHQSGVAYSLVQEDDRELRWCNAPTGLRQMFRRAIAHKMGTPDQFDYSKFPSPEKATKTLEQLYSTV